jgi:peptidoglycan/xylan/chitin deacetylase (PgdA/CDA1 family)
VSTWEIARPILEAYGVPAVAYITSGLVGGVDLGGRRIIKKMSWEEVAALPDAGIAVGSHAANHRSVGLLAAEEAWEEVDRSRRELEERAGAAVRSFAYPFGTRVDCTPETARLVEQAGYDCAFTSHHGSISGGDPELDSFLLPRVKIEAGEPDWHFRRTCRGAMDPWSVVDALMWRLQQNRTETLAED